MSKIHSLFGFFDPLLILNSLISFYRDSQIALKNFRRFSRFFLICMMFLPQILAAAEKRGVLRRSIVSPIISFNPQKASVAHYSVCYDLFEGLVSKDQDGLPQPALAKSWKCTDPNRLEWHFQLREDAKWSDGTIITAHDFVVAYRKLCETVADPTCRNPLAMNYLCQRIPLKNVQSILKGEKPVVALGVKALSHHVLVLQLEHAVAEFKLLTYLSAPIMSLVHCRMFDLLDNTRLLTPKSFIGSGPYVLSGFVDQEKYSLKKNPFYWGAACVKSEDVEYSVYLTSMAAQSAWEKGKLDFFLLSDYLGANYQSFKDQENKNIFLMDSQDPLWIFCNMRVKALQNSNVRLAISMLFPREAFCNTYFPSEATPTYGLLPPESRYAYKPHWHDWTYAKRKEHATMLLSQAGFSSDKPLQLMLKYLDLDLDLEFGDFMQMYLADVPNLQLSYQKQTPQTFAQDIFSGSGNFDLALRRTFLAGRHPFLKYEMFIGPQGKNLFGQENAEFVKKVMQVGLMASTPSYEQMASLEEQFTQDRYVIPLVLLSQEILIRSWVKGLSPSDKTINNYPYSKEYYVVEQEGQELSQEEEQAAAA